MKLSCLIDKMLKGENLPETIVFNEIIFKLTDENDYRCVYGLSLLELVMEEANKMPIGQMKIDLIYEV